MASLATTNLEASLSSFASNFRLLALGSFLLAGIAQGQDKLRGLLLEDDRYNQLPLSIGYGKEVQLPKNVSLRQFVPRVITQATDNTSVAWAAGWYAYTILQARQLNA